MDFGFEALPLEGEGWAGVLGASADAHLRCAPPPPASPRSGAGSLIPLRASGGSPYHSVR